MRRGEAGPALPAINQGTISFKQPVPSLSRPVPHGPGCCSAGCPGPLPRYRMPGGFLSGAAEWPLLPVRPRQGHAGKEWQETARTAIGGLHDVRDATTVDGKVRVTFVMAGNFQNRPGLPPWAQQVRTLFLIQRMPRGRALTVCVGAGELRGAAGGVHGERHHCKGPLSHFRSCATAAWWTVSRPASGALGLPAREEASCNLQSSRRLNAALTGRALNTTRADKAVMNHHDQ